MYKPAIKVLLFSGKKHLLKALIKMKLHNIITMLSVIVVYAGVAFSPVFASDSTHEPHASEHQHHHGDDGHANDHEHHHGDDGHANEHEHHHGDDGHANEHEHHHGDDGHGNEHEHHHLDSDVDDDHHHHHHDKS
jgi:hypothetical protein